MDTTAKTRTDTCACGATVEPVAVTDGDTGPRYHYEHCGPAWWNEDTKTRCETVDLTIPWTDDNGNLNVAKGDLIKEYSEFEQIASVDLIEDGRVVRYEIDGKHGVDFAAPKDLVKVFRYIETVEE